MAEYKNQHFLTRKYLAEFSKDGKIYFYNGKVHKQIPYESQCQKDYFYSKHKAKEVESIFSQGEVLLLNFIKSIEFFLKSELKTAIALSHIVGLYLKNPRIENKTGLERYDAIKSLLADYLVQIILGNAAKNQSLNEIFYELTIRWRMFLLKIPDDVDSQFTTSDSPVAIMTDMAGQPPCFAYLPLSAKTAIFFANKEKYFSQDSVIEISQAGLDKLNTLTAVNSINNVYSKNELSYEQREHFKYGIEHIGFQSRDKIYMMNGNIKFYHNPILIEESVISEFGFLTKNKSDLSFLSYKKAREIYQSGKLDIDHENKKVTDKSNMTMSDLYCATVAENIDKNPLGN
jgi:hypothetical protein